MHSNLVIQCCLEPSAASQRHCQHSHQTIRCARLKPCQLPKVRQLARRSHLSHTRHNHTPLHRHQHRHICQAARPPQKGSEGSEPSSPSQDALRDKIPTSDADQMARKASNATASTSAPSSARSAPPETFGPWPISLFAALQQKFWAMLAQIKKALQRVPAFVQREKLQRLHKQALDEPGNPDG